MVFLRICIQSIIQTLYMQVRSSNVRLFTGHLEAVDQLSLYVIYIQVIYIKLGKNIIRNPLNRDSDLKK